MKDKLSNFMKIEGLTSSRLAEILETQPSSISHIISGRNKPGFDLLKKILERFPNVNPDWLLLDSEQMYRIGRLDSNDKSSLKEDIGELFSTMDISKTMDNNKHDNNNLKEDSNNIPLEALPYVNKAQNRDDIESITVLYRDGTFKSYRNRS